MTNKKISIFWKITNSNRWLINKIHLAEKIPRITLYKIKNSGNWSSEYKFRIYAFLLENKYIRLWQYTITELFNIEEENEK